MKRFFYTLFIALMVSPLTGQVEDFNLDSIGHLDYEADVNDVWGFVDSEGTEYAIVGTQEGSAIISLEDPTDPQEVYFVPGANSTWRDMKTYENFAYITADRGEDGLLIIDLSQASQNQFSHTFYRPELQVDNQLAFLSTCHNLYIDEAGYCYLTGCNLNNGGTLILDLNNTPMAPELVGHTPSVYAHDCYASGDRLYTADIYAGHFSIYDISSIGDPQLLARQNTSFRFTHNLWASDDGNYLYTTDERANAYVDAYDISDLDNIQRVDVFRPESTEGESVIPHNTHFYNNYLVTSWYTDGVKIIDAHRPDNLVEVGSYDTYDGLSGGFNGCWGAYPYLPSGHILATDRSTGLYVLQPDYVRAAYLDGIVIDSISGEPITDATVTIPSHNTTEESTNGEGEFQSGVSDNGVLDVIVEHPFYENKTVQVDLTRGETRNITIELVPLYDSYTLEGEVIDSQSRMALPGAVIDLDGNITSYALATDNGGKFSENVFEDTYDIYTGKWGYEEALNTVVLEQDQSLTIELSEGYKDDYILDLGWTVEGNAASGHWERAVPTSIIFDQLIITPSGDITDDLGEQCYVTGAGGNGAGDRDVDNGVTRLVSPSIALGELNEPVLSYYYWFVAVGGGFGSGDPNDSLKVLWKTDSEEITLRTYWDTSTVWMSDTVYLDQELDSLSEGHIVFSTSDLLGTGHIVEAAVDAFRLFDASPDTTTAVNPPNVAHKHLQVFPNPTNDELHIDQDNAFRLSTETARYRIMDVSGKTLQRAYWTGKPIQVGSLEPGLYFIEIYDPNGTKYSSRFIKE